MKEDLKLKPIVRLLLFCVVYFAPILRFVNVLSVVLNIGVILLVLLLLRNKIPHAAKVTGIIMAVCGVCDSYDCIRWNLGGLFQSEFIEILAGGRLCDVLSELLVSVALILVGLELLGVKCCHRKGAKVFMGISVSVLTLLALFSGVSQTMQILTKYITGASLFLAVWSVPLMYTEEGRAKLKITKDNIKVEAVVIIAMFGIFMFAMLLAGGGSSGSSYSGGMSASDYIKQQDIDLYNSIVGRYNSLTGG